MGVLPSPFYLLEIRSELNENKMKKIVARDLYGPWILEL
jgi:hypothetical protein